MQIESNIYILNIEDIETEDICIEADYICILNIYDIYIEANVYSLNVDDIADRVEYIHIENRRYRDRIYIYRGRIYMYVEYIRRQCTLNIDDIAMGIRSVACIH